MNRVLLAAGMALGMAGCASGCDCPRNGWTQDGVYSLQGVDAGLDDGGVPSVPCDSTCREVGAGLPEDCAYVPEDAGWGVRCKVTLACR